jgi:hypothetical protein
MEKVSEKKTSMQRKMLDVYNSDARGSNSNVMRSVLYSLNDKYMACRKATKQTEQWLVTANANNKILSQKLEKSERDRKLLESDRLKRGDEIRKLRAQEVAWELEVSKLTKEACKNAAELAKFAKRGKANSSDNEQELTFNPPTTVGYQSTQK